MFRSLVIPIDLTPGSERVAARAALLPLAEKPRLTLLHVVPKRLSADARRRAEDDARQALERLARGLALPRGAVVQTVVKSGAPAAEVAKLAKSSKAELIVMGRGGGRPVRDVFLGSTAERVIRQGQLPVLVVRLPAQRPYRRPAVALDLEDLRGAENALALLRRTISAPRPRVSVIHAFEAPFQGLIYPSLSPEEGEAYRAHHREKALKALARLLSECVPPEETPVWRTHVVEGAPRLVIERTVKKTNADLLVLATHCYSGVAHAFLGTVAGDVLRAVPCDVLVTPPCRENARAS